mgnify:CR=1 FL=1
MTYFHKHSLCIRYKSHKKNILDTRRPSLLKHHSPDKFEHSPRRVSVRSNSGEVKIDNDNDDFDHETETFQVGGG